jgi:hypothetical protein
MIMIYIYSPAERSVDNSIPQTNTAINCKIHYVKVTVAFNVIVLVISLAEK